jgi:hypothetical protein
MTSNAIEKLKKEVDAHYEQQKTWHEGLAAGIEEMLNRISAKLPSARNVAMEAAMEIWDEVKAATQEHIAVLEKGRAALELAGAGKGKNRG